MNIHDYINNVIKASRADTLKTSDQLTVSEILLKIEPLLKKQKKVKEKYGHEARVIYDFCRLFPTDIGSWRGSYSELALNYSDWTKESSNGEFLGMEPMKIGDFYNMIKGTIGKTFYGYKGGEHVMGKNTPVWVANYGDSGHTAVINIIDNEYEIIIITGYREF